MPKEYRRRCVTRWPYLLLGRRRLPLTSQVTTGRLPTTPAASPGAAGCISRRLRVRTHSHRSAQHFDPLRQIAQRIHGGAVDPDLEVQMRAGGEARASDEADLLALRDVLPARD